MPEVESRVGASTVDEVMADFDSQRDHLADLSNATERLIQTILKEENIPVQSVQARVKRREKLRAKYCKSDKDYKSLGDIHDVVGLRIITYYSDKLDQIAQIVGQEFAECGPREDKRVVGRLDSFGYSAIHLDCMHLPSRLESTEYRRFAGARFEIQITTILGHAWAEMHHPWYDEADPPSEELRRFHRLAAVLELAEQEFLEIRRKKDDRERIASVRVAAKAPEVPITPESLKAFLDQPFVAELDARLAVIIVGEDATPVAANLNLLIKFCQIVGATTIEQLDAMVHGNADAIAEFAARCRPVYDAVRKDTPPHFMRGLCILHLAYLLQGAKSVQAYVSAMTDAGVSIRPNLDVEKIASVAQEVCRKYGLP